MAGVNARHPGWPPDAQSPAAYSQGWLGCLLSPGRHGPSGALFDSKLVPGLRAEGGIGRVEVLVESVQEIGQFFRGQ